ncbi:Ig-like domain-containing protein [Aquimarina sp. W85]|uniref:Ig-like domain-containing protein n=1 Tax=Aquimarina rhodophyticola TaxID=3342246 RepID=UPI003673420F
MKTTRLLIVFGIFFSLTSCIKEDIIDDQVEPALKITNPLQSLAVGDSYILEAIFTNNIGQEESQNFSWSSSNELAVSVDNKGTVTGNDIGESTITVSTTTNSEVIKTTTVVKVGDKTVVANEPKEGSIISTSSYELKGDFILEKIEDQDFLKLSIANNYVASTALPGLYLYLTNNPNSISGALEIGPVTVFEGAHSYSISTQDATLNQYKFLLYWCKPFSVKVGEGEIK